MDTKLLLTGIVFAATAAVQVSIAQQPGLTVAPVLRSSATVLGQPIVYVKTETPEVSSVIQTYLPGAQTGWHSHLASSHIYVLEGVLTLEIDGGEKKEFRAGEAYMESVDVLHNARNNAATPLKFLVVSYGQKGIVNNLFPKK